MIKGVLVTSLLVVMPPGTVCGERQGPYFTNEPPQKVEFSNSSGAKLECGAHASPPPRIEWLKYDGTRVEKISGLREVHPNGSLYFPSFPGEMYRQDVHDASYQCRVSNSLGTILSRVVRVRAVVKQKYEVQIYDEYVIEGNTAVFRCQVPNYAAEFIIVTSWVEGGKHNIYPNTDTGGKYMVMPNGDLFIFHVSHIDSYSSFGCRTVHKLTGEVQSSNYPGRIFITDPKGGVQPALKVEKRSKKLVKLGESITLPCLAQGYPLPVYRWFREDREKLSPIIGNDRVIFEETGLLYITKARYEDKGKYICRINNTIGEEEVQVTLSVTASLNVHVHPSTQVVDMGKDATLVCSPSGFPVSRVAWFRDGQPLTLNKRYNLTTNPDRLHIAPILKDDQGMYQCFAYNEWDMAQAVAELQLGDASPELIYSFSEQTLQPGPPISLKCVASGNPPPQFTWALDGFPIPDSTRFLVGQYVTVHDDVVSHVNISNIKEEDGGEYTCIAKNTVDKVSHSARINVYGQPFIRVMPKITAVAGNDLIIKCPVAGYPIESITWERDGAVLPINRRQRVYNNGTLVVEQAQRGTDAGTYTCQAQNRQKQTSRRDVEVQVLLPPKILPIQAMTNVLREGMRAAISCQVLEGDLPLTFKWQRNGKDDLGTGAAVRRLDEYSTSLVIEKIASSHSANYTCIAQNIAGSESFTVPLTVNVPPRWTVEPADTNVVLGFDVMLNCQAEGYPEPTIIWRKAVGDRPGEYKDFLYEPNINFYRNGSLEFLHISKESEGHYLCEAKNGISNGVSKVIFLNVNSPAYFHQKSKQVYVEKGSQAHLQCTALGDNPISIVWKLGPQRIGEDFDPRYSVREQLLDEGMVSELGITHVYRHDTGVFNCLANNAYGHDEMSIDLIVQEIPEIPKNIRAIDQQSRQLQLSWNPPYAGNSLITSYVIQYKLVTDPWDAQPSKIVIPGSHTVATVANLHPATSYHLRIVAENKLGFSDPSETIQVTTQEEQPEGAPRDLRAEAKSSTEIYVSWEPPPRETWNGNLLGYYVGYTDTASSTPPSATISQHSNIKTVEVGSQYGGQTILDNLAMFTTYTISVQAFNSRGAGPSSEMVTARTKEGAPSLPPENVSCMTVSATSLDVWWDAPLVEGRNGYIQGYRVSHQPAEEWYEVNDVEVKSTASLRTTLLGLLKYTNYSISVLAFTNSGDGVLSVPVFCRTAEDVPGAPADIKAAMSEQNKILVTWLPPAQRNGMLTGYSIYMGIVDNGKEEGTHKHELSPALEEYETDQIIDGSTYQFWVTASTNIGEGSSTRVVTVTPANKISAKIMSFSQKIVTPWKQNITLECRTVGVPSPRTSWKFEGKGIESRNKRFELRKTGALSIRDIQHSDQGNYSCNAENVHGSDSIIYHVAVRVPPEPPVLQVTRSESDSLHLKWNDKGSIDIPILGYIIHYKRDQGDWEELQLKAKQTSHVLTNLWCGTHYKLYMTAYNKIATGLPCDIVNAKTKGSAPLKPNPVQLLTVNATAITFWLEAWIDGGCPILFYIIEYREESRPDWLLATNHIQPADRMYTIYDLRSATRYYLKMKAHNNAGSTIAIYNVTTLSADGSPVFPKVEPSPEQNSPSTYAGSKAALPIALMFFTFACVLLGWFYFKKRKENHQLRLGESASLAQMQNQHNRDQQYAVQGAQLPAISIEPAVFKPEAAEYIEDVCPYATFQLAKTPYTESTFSGNVYSGPYHSVRGSFVYHDLPSGTETYKGRHMKEPEYTKVRRKGGRLRDSHPESQVAKKTAKQVKSIRKKGDVCESCTSSEICSFSESTMRRKVPPTVYFKKSDNLGSTDSEVKKILTLHLPISEYDTHGSDSEDIPRGPSAQDLVTFRHCLSRDIINGAEESSSSSERSPTGLRKQCPTSRKMKGKFQSSMKKNMKCGSSYSGHTEETSFSYGERIKPPSRFSDGCHGDCDTSGSRRGSRAVPYRLSRESTFQIDV